MKISFRPVLRILWGFFKSVLIIAIIFTVIAAIASVVSATFEPEADGSSAISKQPEPDPAASTPKQAEKKLPILTSGTTTLDLRSMAQAADSPSEEACTKEGGHWNTCVSSCNGVSNETVCIEACLIRCECGGEDRWRCPQGYVCRDWAPSSEDPNATGICHEARVALVEVSTLENDNGGIFAVLPRQITLANPFRITAPRAVLDGQTEWQVKDGKGNVIAWGSLARLGSVKEVEGRLVTEAYFDEPPQTQDGQMEMFEFSSKTRFVSNVIYSKVSFTADRQPVKVFFLDRADNPDSKDCGRVAPVRRVVMGGSEPDKVLMHELLRGPSDADIQNGFGTAIPAGVHIPTIHEEGRKIYADFDGTLAKAGGACRATAARSQITETLKSAYPGDDVVISINGVTEGILQP